MKTMFSYTGDGLLWVLCIQVAGSIPCTLRFQQAGSCSLYHQETRCLQRPAITALYGPSTASTGQYSKTFASAASKTIKL